MNKASLEQPRRTRLLRAVGRGINTPADITELMGINRGHVATALREFAAAGLMTSTATGCRSRIAYALTEQGREEAKK